MAEVSPAASEKVWNFDGLKIMRHCQSPDISSRVATTRFRRTDAVVDEGSILRSARTFASSIEPSL